ncbi:Nn.00g084060.m01.CDS01 [Neocucurbitaria sp. VM-36]
MSDSDISRSLSPTTSNSSSAPPPLSELQQLKVALSVQFDKAVLEHCLGLSKLPGILPLANCMIAVCFDTESWVYDHDKLTEIGVATFDSRDMYAVKEPGKYGGKLLEQVYFYHARIKEYSHLLNLKYCVGDPDTTRSGQTRFLTKDQACAMLTELFAWQKVLRPLRRQ